MRYHYKNVLYSWIPLHYSILPVYVGTVRRWWYQLHMFVCLFACHASGLSASRQWVWFLNLLQCRYLLIDLNSVFSVL